MASVRLEKPLEPSGSGGFHFLASHFLGDRRKERNMDRHLARVLIVIMTTLAALPLAASSSLAAECTEAGTSGSDVIVGTPQADVLCGLSGNDFIRGVRGNDIVRGGTGADDLDGGPGADLVRGGRGRDSLTGGIGGERWSYRILRAASWCSASS